MNNKNVYSRKISLKEANNDFIFILKNKLSFFPELGEKFDLEDGNSNEKVVVECYPCTCRGPDRPHEHYFIHWKGLESGDRIDIFKSENGSRYILNVHL